MRGADPGQSPGLPSLDLRDPSRPLRATRPAARSRYLSRVARPGQPAAGRPGPGRTAARAGWGSVASRRASASSPAGTPGPRHGRRAAGSEKVMSRVIAQISWARNMTAGLSSRVGNFRCQARRPRCRDRTAEQLQDDHRPGRTAGCTASRPSFNGSRVEQQGGEPDRLRMRRLVDSPLLTVPEQPGQYRERWRLALPQKAGIRVGAVLDKIIIDCSASAAGRSELARPYARYSNGSTPSAHRGDRRLRDLRRDAE